jgi:hypothetical protein
MSRCYLRVEGVNIAAVTTDTQDLSTIRGGGLLLLEAVKEVETVFALTPISTGASVGLFEFDDGDPAGKRAKVADFLRTHTMYRHATFVVDVVEAQGDAHFRDDVERLVALNRYRQMRSPSLALGDSAATANGPCQHDFVRPAVTRKGDKDASESVAERHDFGRRQRQGFYARWLDRRVTVDFTDDLNDLAARHTGSPADGKIAVIKADGNKFGKLQRTRCTTPALQRAFDTTIKDYRRSYLDALVKEAEQASGLTGPDRDLRISPNGRARLEVLTWGGDEFVLVVPAWLGWHTASLLFELSAGTPPFKRPEGTPPWEVALGASTSQLTHAAAIVFCHSNAPIHQVTHLAEELVKEVKHQLEAHTVSEHHPSANVLTYQVLESFDHLGPDPTSARVNALPAGVGSDQLVVRGPAMKAVAGALGSLHQNEFPRSVLIPAVNGLRGGAGTAPQKAMERLDAAIASTPGAPTAFEEIRKAVGLTPADTLSAAVHVAELWDYLG